MGRRNGRPLVMEASGCPAGAEPGRVSQDPLLPSPPHPLPSGALKCLLPVQPLGSTANWATSSKRDLTLRKQETGEKGLGIEQRYQEVRDLIRGAWGCGKWGGERICVFAKPGWDCGRSEEEGGPGEASWVSHILCAFRDNTGEIRALRSPPLLCTHRCSSHYFARILSNPWEQGED